MKKVAIVGGGIAGLLSAIQVVRSGIACILFEKKHYPFHRVCGEYVSGEAIPFLRSLDLFPSAFNPPSIKRFLLSAVSGKQKILPLDMGGFGISRFSFDNYLHQEARKSGVVFHLGKAVDNVTFHGGGFLLESGDDRIEADVVLAAYGKRTQLDVRLGRDFTHKRSPYLGVKYHVRMDHPSDLVALHNFPGGYCGIGAVEDNKVNLCYLVHRDKLRAFKSIPDMEQGVLFRNPLIRNAFDHADFLFTKPETINEISFETKAPVEAHMLMVGDSAGMITPLCGNGMAMAMHAAQIASRLAVRFCSEASYSRQQLESDYTAIWKRTFRRRLSAGRQIQKLFGSDHASAFAVNLAVFVPAIARAMIRNTHGKPF